MPKEKIDIVTAVGANGTMGMDISAYRGHMLAFPQRGYIRMEGKYGDFFDVYNK